MPSRQNYVVIVVIIDVQQQNSVKYYIILCMFILEYTYYSVYTRICQFNFNPNSTEVKSKCAHTTVRTLCTWM